jgi:hypothetical protein
VNEVLPSRKKKEAVPMIEGLGDRMLQVRKIGMTTQQQINQSVWLTHLCTSKEPKPAESFDEDGCKSPLEKKGMDARTKFISEDS